MTTDITKAAAALGRKGGQARTEAKQASSRANGKKGGRPRSLCRCPRRTRTQPSADHARTIVE